MHCASRGRFVTFEGVEGAGKSTQVRIFAETAEAAGLKVVLTREPGGCESAERIRELLLHPPAGGLSPLSEALLHYAARREHLGKTIEPALAEGYWVVCDRFADSTMAYQGYGLELGAGVVSALHDLVVGDFAADITVILDMPIETGLARAKARSPEGDRYERLDFDFHRRVRDGFLEIARAHPARCIVIDADRTQEAVADAVRMEIARRLGVTL